ASAAGRDRGALCLSAGRRLALDLCRDRPAGALPELLRGGGAGLSEAALPSAARAHAIPGSPPVPATPRACALHRARCPRGEALPSGGIGAGVELGAGYFGSDRLDQPSVVRRRRIDARAYRRVAE